MSEIDIEDLDFDEYNKNVYIEENLPSFKRMNQPKFSDAQKRFKSEIDKFVAEYELNLERNELGENNSLISAKKRKICN